MSLQPCHALRSAAVIGANSFSWIVSLDGTDAVASSSAIITAVAADALSAAARRGRELRGAGDGETGDDGSSILGSFMASSSAASFGVSFGVSLARLCRLFALPLPLPLVLPVPSSATLARLAGCGVLAEPRRRVIGTRQKPAEQREKVVMRQPCDPASSLKVPISKVSKQPNTLIKGVRK